MAVKKEWQTKISRAQTPGELYSLLTKASPWRARTLRHLPTALKIDASQYAKLEALRFGQLEISAFSALTFSALRVNLEQLVAKSPVTIYPH